MGFLALLAVGVLVGIPTIAIIALVRTGTLRRLLDESSWENRDKFSDHEKQLSGLQRQVSDLRHELAQLSEQRDSQSPVSPPIAPAVHLHEPERPVETALAAVVESEPVAPEPIAAFSDVATQEPCEAQTVIAPVPYVYLKQAKPDPPPMPNKPTEMRLDQVSAKSQAEQSTRSRETEHPCHATVRTVLPSFSMPEEPPRKSFAERLRSTLPFEELLGMNLFAKIGIILLVLGFALLGRVALISMGPGARVAMIYVAAAAMLCGGIWLEGKERYRLIGRTGIGGGWALLFFTTYAMYHVPAMMIMTSNTLNCIFMLVVAIAMVAHTLRYKSQLVTGLAFLLAFSTIALSQDSVYALAAGVILAAGIVAITLRMGWYELEVFGILASYANHFYWLYRLFPDGVNGLSFPQFWPSAIILIFYWTIFRISYVARKIHVPRDEKISTVAALLNTMLLLGVMKFQSTHPEYAFFALLGLGAMEFLFGQLPVTRRRRPAFILLTVIGTLLFFAAFPFKFSGNNIALFWMIAAEVLLIAGINQNEVIFRRLGLLAGLITGLLVVYEASDIFILRHSSNAPRIQDGILLLTCSTLFYLNALFIRRKWFSLFGAFDGTIITFHNYIGCITAFLGLWAAITGDWTAVAWAVLMLGAIIGKKYLDDNHLLTQGALLLVPVWFTAVMVNGHLSDVYPHHIVTRLVTIPIFSLILYGAAWALSGFNDLRVHLRMLKLWAGSSLLALLAWCEVPPVWVALAWVALSVALYLIARRFNLKDFAYQGHLLSVAVGVQLLTVNLYAQSPLERYLPFLGCAATFYAISRFCTLRDAPYRRQAAWMHTWAATALIASLAWNETPQLWLTAIWAVFALALAIVDRIFEVEEFPYQAHVLALLAVLRAVNLNLYTRDQWRDIDMRLITVLILIAVLYALARWVRMPETLNARHAYTWVASGLTAWLLWSELQPISVAVGLAVFGLVLFELGTWRQQKQIRLQGYTALAAAFARIFFVNLTASTLPGESISPRIFTVVPIALIFFFVWARLQSEKITSEIGRWSPCDLIAYFGTVCIAAVLYFDTPVEWIVVTWAALALVLVITTWLLDKEVFLQQAVLLTLGIAGRGIAHNIYGGSYFSADGWRGNFAVLLITSALLLTTLPVTFRLRKRYADYPIESRLSRILALKRPEQWFFFAPVLLITLMIAVKLNPGMVTLSWGIEGVVVIILGLLVSERSYRITGLLLLLLCVGKIVCLDAWRLSDTDRYITFIALGGALTLVSWLYSKYREIVRRLL